MDLALNEEQQLIVDMVRRFVHEEILPLEATLDPDADELPREDYERLVAMVQEMGFYGLDTPPEYDGPDIDLVTRCLIAIECAQHRAGLYAPCYYAFGGARQAQLFEGPQKRRKRNTSTTPCYAVRNVFFLPSQSLQEGVIRGGPSRRGR